LVVMDEVFIAQRQRKNPLPDHGSDGVLDQSGARLSAKHSADRSTSRIAWSAAPSSKAPARPRLRLHLS
jgi:hypothetical protein